MGTNYYCTTGKTKHVICDYGYEHDIPEKLHIGKNSFGWVFRLQGYKNDEYNLTSLEEWQSLLKNAKRIFNEYNEDISYDEMINMIKKPDRDISSIKSEIEKSLKEMNDHDYYKVKLVNGLFAGKNEKVFSKNGNYTIDYHEFC